MRSEPLENPMWLQNYTEKIFPTPLVNFGGAVHRTDALRHCVVLAWKLQKGGYNDLVFRLKRLLGLTERRILEDYIPELEESGIIVRLSDGAWMYTGKQTE